MAYTAISTRVREICAEHWTPIATRCEGCPLFEACNAPLPGPLAVATLNSYSSRLNAVAKSLKIVSCTLSNTR